MFANTSSILSATISPSTLIQDTIGEGIPETLHNRVKFSPSVIFTFCIGCMVEGTEINSNQMLVNMVQIWNLTGCSGVDLHHYKHLHTSIHVYNQSIFGIQQKKTCVFILAIHVNQLLTIPTRKSYQLYNTCILIILK